MTRILLSLTFILNFACDISACNQDPIKSKFDLMNSYSWKEVMHDDGSEDWQNKWFLDGEKANVYNENEGIMFFAGEKPADNAGHSVLWTKQSFKGNLKIEFDFIRLDSTNRFVNIIYIQAEGKGKSPYVKDIFEWKDLRNIPAMNMYFNNMNTLHISFAAFENDIDESKNREYIRARRYIPNNADGLLNTDLEPECFVDNLFKTNIKYHITIIKHDEYLIMNVSENTNESYYMFSLKDIREVDHGRIGLRLMSSRKSFFKDFRVFEISE